jgi:hypothetical protein
MRLCSGMVLLLAAIASTAVEGSGVGVARNRFVLDSTGSTYPFVVRVEGTFAQKANTLEITVEAGLVHSAIPEDVGAEGVATDIEVAMGLGKSTEQGWTMDIEAPQQFVAMKLNPGETQVISRRTFVIKNLAKVNLAERWLSARLTVKQALPGVQPGLLSSYACSEQNLLGATPASRERANKMRGGYSHTC